MKKFDIDSPIMNFLSRVANLLLINIITLILIAPVITAGAAFTAMYYSCLKIRRDEDSGILKAYFHSFKMNFKEATIIWLIMIISVCIPAGGLTYYLQTGGEQMAIKILLSGVIFLLFFCYTMTFPVLSRFSNSVAGTIKQGVMMSLSNPPRSFLIMVATLTPFYMLYLFRITLPFIIAFGLSLPAFIAVCLYNRSFEKIESSIKNQ